MAQSKQDFTRVHSVLTRACAELGLEVTEAKKASISRLIAGTMGGKARFFHNPDHVIHVGSHGDSISVIAALFHDLVYLQVDEGMGNEVSALVDSAIEQNAGSLRVREVLAEEAQLACELFDVHPGTQISKMQGLNEFLSAMAASQVLHPVAGASTVAQILCCIELTIPFRGRDKTGRSAAEQLYDRLAKVDRKLHLNLGDQGCRQAIRRAVRLANQDVSSFAASTGADFLAHTWELVPETNPLLRAPTAASVEAFAKALLQMEGFFSNLAPKSVFQQFDGEPSNHDLEVLAQNAARNIEEGRYYFRLKVTALAILEAAGESLGKNMGLPVLLGELSNLAVGKQKVAKFLPQKGKVAQVEGGLARRVLKLLENPHTEEIGPTLKSSPMAAFLLLELGFEQMLKLWEPAGEYLRGKISSHQLLQYFPQPTYKRVMLAIQSAIKAPARAKKVKKAS